MESWLLWSLLIGAVVYWIGTILFVMQIAFL
jgi:hypothetical protein